MHRTFTVTSVTTARGVEKGSENIGGVFKSLTPVGAARKAATKICAKSRIKGQCTLYIVVRETTRGSANKEYRYKVKRIKQVTTVLKDGVPITFQYVTKAFSA